MCIFCATLINHDSFLSIFLPLLSLLCVVCCSFFIIFFLPFPETVFFSSLIFPSFVSPSTVDICLMQPMLNNLIFAFLSVISSGCGIKWLLLDTYSFLKLFFVCTIPIGMSYSFLSVASCVTLTAFCLLVMVSMA